jgi:hypothetical protein
VTKSKSSTFSIDWTHGDAAGFAPRLRLASGCYGDRQKTAAYSFGTFVEKPVHRKTPSYSCRTFLSRQGASSLDKHCGS